MNNLEHASVTVDPLLRVRHYRTMVRSYYECVTAAYRQFWGDCYHFALFRGDESREEATVTTERMIADEGAFHKGLTVLDVGCGLGGPTLNIAEYSGADITAVDLCEHHVRIASERARIRNLEDRVRFLVADGMHLPFADATFDRVYVFESGCHMPDKMAFCLECARVLKPDGEFLGLDWMQRSGLTQAEEEQYIEPICQFCSLPDMISPQMMTQHLQWSGFNVLVSDEACSQEALVRNFQTPNAALGFVSHNCDPEALRRVSLGGFALERAAKAGAFIIGHWHARKFV
jgi:ubiquinone/menaquinone biosynthesis C-methylase UbiE